MDAKSKAARLRLACHGLTADAMARCLRSQGFDTMTRDRLLKIERGVLRGTDAERQAMADVLGAPAWLLLPR